MVFIRQRNELPQLHILVHICQLAPEVCRLQKAELLQR